MTQLHKYTAYRLTPSGRRWSIVSILARDDDHARQRVAEQLDRPGRRAYYQQWIESGQIVERQTE